MDFPPPEALADTLQPMAAAPYFLAGPAGTGQLCHVILLSPCGIPSWKCSPSRFSAPGLAFQGHTLHSGALCPWQLCRAMSDTLLGPFGSHQLPGLPVGPAKPGRGSFLPHRAPSMSLPSAPSPRTVAPSQLSGAVRHCLRYSGLSESTGERVSGTFALFKQNSTVLGFFGLLLIPGSAALLLNQLVSKPWETGRLPLPGSIYFVTLLLYVTYYNLYQIALCLLKWTIRIQL